MSDNHYPMMEYYFQHYKGGYYKREGEALHSETKEPMVIYRGVSEDPREERTWVRPAAMWSELVDGGSGHMVPRFRPATPEDFAHVLKFHLQCPNCDQPQAMGEFSTEDKAWAAMQEKGYCSNCDEEVGRYRSPWVHKTDFWILKPLLKRHMEGVQ